MSHFTAPKFFGKDLSYVLKYTYRHAPHVLLMIPLYGILLPAVCYYSSLSEDDRIIKKALYKDKYIIFREGDPRIAHIPYHDENGKLHLPEWYVKKNGKK